MQVAGPAKPYFDQAPKDTKYHAASFASLNLSRPLVKACTELGYTTPTPIQVMHVHVWQGCTLHMGASQVVQPSLLTIQIQVDAGRMCSAGAAGARHLWKRTDRCKTCRMCKCCVRNDGVSAYVDEASGHRHAGSGKTAAFALPLLERLLFRSRRVPAIYVLVLTPTRELAVQVCPGPKPTMSDNTGCRAFNMQHEDTRMRQCLTVMCTIELPAGGHQQSCAGCLQVHSMITKLAQFTDVRVALAVGGLSLQVQAATLRTSPEILVATPVSIAACAALPFVVDPVHAPVWSSCHHAVRLTRRSRFLACDKPSATPNLTWLSDWRSLSMRR